MAGSESSIPGVASAQQSAKVDLGGKHDFLPTGWRSRQRLLIESKRAATDPVPAGTWDYLFYQLDQWWDSFFSSKLIMWSGALFVLVFLISVLIFYALMNMQGVKIPERVAAPPAPVFFERNLNFYTPPQSKTPIIRTVADAQAAAQASPVVSPAAVK